MSITDRIPDHILNSFQTATIPFNYLKRKGLRRPFHALIELTDNSKDAHAKNVEIDFVVRNQQNFIEILDDGDGMTQQEVAKIVASGCTEKRSFDKDKIGVFGTGLISGGLRLGREVLLLTKKENKYTAMMLSHKFMARSEKFFVPSPCFDEKFRPVTNDQELHKAEVMAINLWGPLGGQSLCSLFAKIQGASGTLIIIGSLKRDYSGSLEMSVSATGEDVNIESDEQDEWKSSLRKHLEILYMDSTMKIHLRGREVEQKQVAEWFVLKRVRTIHDINGPGSWEKQNAELQNELDLLRPNEVAKKLEETSVRLEEEKKENNENDKKKRRDVSIDFNCGLKCKDRHNYGIYFYLNKRLLIAEYKNIGFFKNHTNIGVCMVICLTYDMVSPTADKQGIENAYDFETLLESCSLVLNIYREYLAREAIPDFCLQNFGFRYKNPGTLFVMEPFWLKLGYRSPLSFKCQQGELMKNIEKGIHRECGFWRKCHQCQYWRQIMAARPPPEHFQCASQCNPAPDVPRYCTLLVRPHQPRPVRLPVSLQVAKVEPETPPASPSRLQSTGREKCGECSEEEPDDKKGGARWLAAHLNKVHGVQVNTAAEQHSSTRGDCAKALNNAALSLFLSKKSAPSPLKRKAEVPIASFKISSTSRSSPTNSPPVKKFFAAVAATPSPSRARTPASSKRNPEVIVLDDTPSSEPTRKDVNIWCLTRETGIEAWIDTDVMKLYCVDVTEKNPKYGFIDPLNYVIGCTETIRMLTSNTEKEAFLYPICQDNHWTLLVIGRTAAKYYDPLRKAVPEKVRKLLEELQKPLVDFEFETPRQNDGWNCGVHVMQMAKAVATNTVISQAESEENLKTFRKRLQDDLKRKYKDKVFAEKINFH